jgi:hypothetical protein
MNRVLRGCAAAVSVAAFLLSGSFASGQALTSLRGKVTDLSGAAVPNATVHLISPNNADRTAATDPAGVYAFSNVSPAVYRLRVEAQGFEEFEESDIDLTANTASAPKTVDIKLQVKQVEQTVTVRAEPGVECLTPQSRILPDVGPGLRALRPGPLGNYYVLTAPGASVGIYSPQGTRIGQIPVASASSAPASPIVNGSDLQVDSAGRVYVADFAANAIKVYSAEGTLDKTIRVAAPISVEPLPGGEIAVGSLGAKHPAEVYDEQRGVVYRSIGDGPAPIDVECDASSLTCSEVGKKSQPATQLLGNRSWFFGDSAGNLYVNLADTPSPTIRKYDAYGYLDYESTIPLSRDASGSSTSAWTINPDVRVAGMGTLSFGSDGSQSYSSGSSGNNSNSVSADGQTSGGRSGMGGGMRGMGGGEEIRGGGGGGRGGLESPQFGLRITQRADIPESKPTVESIAVDPSEEMWAAIGDDLVHFDKDGALVGYYCLSTTDHSAIRPTTILVESNRILVGSNPFGVFQYARPDKPLPDASASH